MITNRNTTMIAPAYTSTWIDADELRVEQHVQRREAEHRVHEPQRGGDGTLPRDERERRGDRDEAEEIEVERVEQREHVCVHHSPFGSAGSHISHTGCVCAISRSRS